MTVTFEDFKKLEIRIGTIVSAERVPDTDKLLKLTVDCGEGRLRQIISGISEHCEPEELSGVQCPFLLNIEPRTIRGLISEGMILAIGENDTFSLLHPAKTTPAGTEIH